MLTHVKEARTCLDFGRYRNSFEAVINVHFHLFGTFCIIVHIYI